MARYLRLFVLPLLFVYQGQARQDRTICGTSREKVKEDLHLHRQALKLRRQAGSRLRPLEADTRAAAVGKDVGGVAVLEDTDGIVAKRNDFNLDNRTLSFLPRTAAADRYTFQTEGPSYDLDAASNGGRLSGLGDDDSRRVDLPFLFPFFGKSYNQVYINSDGNLTFGAGDNTSADRSLGRMTAGPPRIAALYRDLDPSVSAGGVKVLSAPGRFSVTWAQVPEFTEFGGGTPQTFQIRLFPNGRIEFAYFGIETRSAVVGVSPGGLQGSSTILSFIEGSTQEFSSTIAERFGGDVEIDLVTAAQKFYELHEDSYEYLVFFNNMGVPDGPTSLASERTVRQTRKGIGDQVIDLGREYGSASRLLAVLNLGTLSQYNNLDEFVRGREGSRDTPLTVLAHEAGHLFLAFASVRDPLDPESRPMLGFQNAHWSFDFNSEASLLEGNRIQDNCPGADGLCPDGRRRFTTIAVTEGFSAFDQYLMGLRAAEEVPPSFVVTESTKSPLSHPRVGVEFDGKRREIKVEELIQAEGRRTPDHTVEQKRFRFAFVLIVPQNTDTTSPTVQAELQKLEEFRQRFEAFFSTATQGRAIADTTLRRTVKLSTYPATGVVLGRSTAASLSLQKPADAPFTITLSAVTVNGGAANIPSIVTVPAGAASASFTIEGTSPGVVELKAVPSDDRYETAISRIQIASSLDSLNVVTVSGDRQAGAAGIPLLQPVVFKVTDANELPYAGVTVQLSASSGGQVSPSAVTDQNGIVSVQWTPGSGIVNQLTASVMGAVSAIPAKATLLGPPAMNTGGVVNAATLKAGLSTGSLGTIFGINLAANLAVQAAPPWPSALGQVQVLLKGRPAPLLYVSDDQINFQVPPDTPPGQAEVRVITALGTSAPITVPILNSSPGIFVIDSERNLGAIQIATTGKLTTDTPAGPGDYVAIYVTGLGAVHRTARGYDETASTPRVFIGSVESPEIPFSGMVPGIPGLYLINAKVPPGLPSGMQTLSFTFDGQQSNEVVLQLR